METIDFVLEKATKNFQYTVDSFYLLYYTLYYQGVE